MTLDAARRIIDKMIEGQPDAVRRELLAKFKENCTLVDVRERFGKDLNDFVS